MKSLNFSRNYDHKTKIGYIKIVTTMNILCFVRISDNFCAVNSNTLEADRTRNAFGTDHIFRKFSLQKLRCKS